MSRENVELVERLFTAWLRGDLVGALEDRARMAELEAAMARWAQRDFEWAMIGPVYASPGQQGFEGHGVDGLLDAWREWISAYERYEIEPEEMIDLGDRVLMLVRQVGVTRTGGVEMENLGAALAWVRDERITKVEFYLDRDAAMKAAGLQ